MSEVTTAFIFKQATSIAQLASTHFLSQFLPFYFLPFTCQTNMVVTVFHFRNGMNSSGRGCSFVRNGIAKARSATAVLFGVGISIMASLRMFPFVLLKRFPPLRRTRHHVNLAARLKLQIQSLQAMLFSPLPVT